MADYTTELLHISSYVIGILLGALVCTIVIIFYYRKQLRSIGEGADEADAAALEDERLEDEPTGEEKPETGPTGTRPTGNGSSEGESPEGESPEEEPSEEEPSEEAPLATPSKSKKSKKRTTKAEAAEEQLYDQVTRVIAEERLYLKPGFGRTDIVARFGISAHRAGMIFSKRETSIPEFVRNCRLDYALRQMAEEPDASLADIATAAGFIHLSTFIRDFKDRYGMTPARYRESQPIHELQTE